MKNRRNGRYYNGIDIDSDEYRLRKQYFVISV